MSRRDNLALGNQSQRALRLLALAATVAMASPALAQNNPFGQLPGTPPSPFQEKSSPPAPVKLGVTTPQTQINAIEVWAKEREAKQNRPLERERYCIIVDPNRDEFEALGRYGLLILTLVTQSAEELPIKRVYLRMRDREIPLLKIGSWRRDVDQTLVTYKMYGPYREDGFYLFPFSAYLRVAQLQVDLAANRSGLPVLEMPMQDVTGWLRTMQNPDPLPGTLPNLRALQNLIKRNTSGFPIPTSLPQVAPEARRPTPVPAPQSDEPKKPAALGDLFKK